jgi:hypothetical protein
MSSQNFNVAHRLSQRKQSNASSSKMSTKTEQDCEAIIKKSGFEDFPKECRRFESIAAQERTHLNGVFEGMTAGDKANMLKNRIHGVENR